MSSTLTAPQATAAAVAPHRDTLRSVVQVYRVEAWQDERGRPFAAATGHFLMPPPRGEA